MVQFSTISNFHIESWSWKKNQWTAIVQSVLVYWLTLQSEDQCQDVFCIHVCNKRKEEENINVWWFNYFLSTFDIFIKNT